MSRTTHNQRIARGLKKVTGLGYQTCLNKVIAAAEAGLLPTPLDEAGIEKAVAMLASGITVATSDPKADASIEDVLRLPHGLVLVVGVDRTGKTTLLYEAVRESAGRDRKVITVENPIEQFLGQGPDADGKGFIVQTQWGEGEDYKDFAKAHRSALRQDPDVVVYDEIRDVEQAQAATDAALTGHLSFASVHASSVEQAIERLILVHPAERNAEARHLLAESLKAIIMLDRDGGKFTREITLIDDEMRERIRANGEVSAPDPVRVSFQIGENAAGSPVSWRADWDDHPVLSIVGPSGSGKSVLAASLARLSADADDEVFVIDTTKDGADYRDGQTVIRTDKGALRLLANLRTPGPFDRLLVVEEPQALRPDVVENLRRLIAEARSHRLRVVLVSQEDSFLGPVGSKVDFTPGTAPARGWAQFRDQSKHRFADVRVWGPTVDEIAAERQSRSAQEAPKAVAVDLRRLSTLLRAGLSPAPALAAVAKSSRNDLAREAFSQMAQVVGNGDAELSDALRAHPHLFDEWIAAAVEAGETAGIVSTILDDVSGTLAAEVA